MPQIEPISVTVEDGCRAFGVGRTKMYELMDAGDVESFTVGKRRLINYASLKALAQRLASDPVREAA